MTDRTYTKRFDPPLRARYGPGAQLDTSIDAIEIEVLNDQIYSMDVLYSGRTIEPFEDWTFSAQVDVILQTLGVDIAFDVNPEEEDHDEAKITYDVFSNHDDAVKAFAAIPGVVLS